MKSFFTIFLSVFLIVFVSFYAIASFIWWDIGWMNHLSSWSPNTRFMWFWLMILTPAYAGVATWWIKQ